MTIIHETQELSNVKDQKFAKVQLLVLCYINSKTDPTSPKIIEQLERSFEKNKDDANYKFKKEVKLLRSIRKILEKYTDIKECQETLPLVNNLLDKITNR